MKTKCRNYSCPRCGDKCIQKDIIHSFTSDFSLPITPAFILTVNIDSVKVLKVFLVPWEKEVLP